MGTLRRILNRLRRRTLERDFDDEIRFHLEERRRRNLAAQMSPDAAARDALERFGSIDRAKRGMRAARIQRLDGAVAAAMIAALLGAATMYWRAASRVYDLGPGVTPPVPVASVRPQYPPSALRAKIQGTVRVRCVVGRNGVCRDVAVVKSVDRALGVDDAAVQALRGWRFRPALVGGAAVPARVLI